MKLPPPVHTWKVSTQEAIIIQKQLAKLIDISKPAQPLDVIAGLDAAFSNNGKICIAGVVVWSISQKKILEQYTASQVVNFSYIPGFLSFREAPALLTVLSKLKITPDALMCDGQGLAHPRRLGIASHLGVLTQMPALGCGKSRLIGDYQEPGKTRGDKSLLMNKNEVIGTVLRTKNDTKPLFVSVGHKLDLTTAEDTVLRCFNGYRLPEPTRLADKLVSQIKREKYSGE